MGAPDHRCCTRTAGGTALVVDARAYAAVALPLLDPHVPC